MKKLFIIILSPISNASDIRKRIEKLGEYYIIYDNQYLVLSDIEDSHSVYSQIVKDEDNVAGIVILSVPINNLTYWGYSDKNLWEWLRKYTKDSV